MIWSSELIEVKLTSSMRQRRRCWFILVSWIEPQSILAALRAFPLPIMLETRSGMRDARRRDAAMRVSFICAAVRGVEGGRRSPPGQRASWKMWRRCSTLVGSASARSESRSFLELAESPLGSPFDSPAKNLLQDNDDSLPPHPVFLKIKHLDEQITNGCSEPRAFVQHRKRSEVGIRT